MTEPAPVAPAAVAPSAPAAPAAPAPSTPAPAAPPADPWADFKPPEGFTIDGLKPVIEFAKQHGMDPKAAAALALRDKAAADKEAAEFKHLSEKGWLEELTADPELGGAKIRETMVDVMRAHDKLPPKVQAMIKDAGVLYNPIVARLLHAVGSQSKEDSFVRPGTSPAPQKKMTQDEALQSLFAAPTTK